MSCRYTRSENRPQAVYSRKIEFCTPKKIHWEGGVSFLGGGVFEIRCGTTSLCRPLSTCPTWDSNRGGIAIGEEHRTGTVFGLVLSLRMNPWGRLIFSLFLEESPAAYTRPATEKKSSRSRAQSWCRVHDVHISEKTHTEHERKAKMVADLVI